MVLRSPLLLSPYQISCSMHPLEHGALRLHRTVILIIVHSLLTLVWCGQCWDLGLWPPPCPQCPLSDNNELVVVVQLVVNVVREIQL